MALTNSSRCGILTWLPSVSIREMSALESKETCRLCPMIRPSAFLFTAALRAKALAAKATPPLGWRRSDVARPVAPWPYCSIPSASPIPAVRCFAHWMTQVQSPRDRPMPLSLRVGCSSKPGEILQAAQITRSDSTPSLIGGCASTEFRSATEPSPKLPTFAPVSFLAAPRAQGGPARAIRPAVPPKRIISFEIGATLRRFGS